MTEEIAVQVERDILGRLEKIKNEKGMTDVQWGDIAFAGQKNGRRKVQNLKHVGLRLRVGDFIQLCAALNVDPARILSNALDNNNL